MTTPEGTSAIVAADKWTYTNLPLVTGANRRVLSAQGGETLTVMGSNLAGATELIVGSTHVPVEESTAGTATAITPAGTGTVAVRVVSSYGTSRTAVSATYTSLDERYRYNGDGLRVETTSADGTSRQTTWDPFSDVARPLADGNRRFVYGADGSPLEQIEANGSTSYFVHDQLGSTRALLGPAGEVAATFAYGPYGQLTARAGTATTPLLFAGGYQDQTGLIYLLNRYLDPATGVFVTVDPALQFTGQPYTYGAGDPVNSIDPNGLIPTIFLGLIMGAAVGVVSGAISYATSDEDNPSLWRHLVGGAAGGAISGACIGSGVGMLASTACGAAAGAADDFISRGQIDDQLAESALTGALFSVGGVPRALRNKMAATNGRWGGLKLSNLWHPGKIATGMWKEVGEGAMADGLLDVGNYLWHQQQSQPAEQPEDWLADLLRCGQV